MIRAVIFDMDGVVSDTQGLHTAVEESLLRKHGIRMSAQEITEKYASVPDKEFFGKLFKEHKVSVNPDSVIKEKYRIMSASKSRIVPIAGVKELIQELKKQKFMLAIASASPLEFIEFVISELGLKGIFDSITSSNEVSRGKPEPDVFLLAAKKLGCKPEECVVIEDTSRGMTAAKRAGMKCIGFAWDHEKEYPADILVKDLREITVEMIRGM